MDIIHVGLGMRGRRWLALAHRYPGVKSVGCVDPDPSTLDWTKTHFPELGKACYARLEDALTGKKADAAIVASPIPVRAAHAVTALEAGLSVMIDRPFAASVAEAARVLDASRRVGRHVMVAQNHRFATCERTLQQLVREGRVGSITHVSCVDRRSASAIDHQLAEASYTQLMHAGADHFDSMRSILGVNAVTAMARCTTAPWSKYGHGSTIEAILEMEGRVYVQYHGSLTSNRNEHSLWIDGDKGSLWTDRAHVWWRKRGWPLFVPLWAQKVQKGDAAKHPPDGMATLLDQLKAATLESRAPETTGEDNLWTLSMIEAAIISDRTGRVAHISELLSAAGIVRSTSTTNLPGAG